MNEDYSSYVLNTYTQLQKAISPLGINKVILSIYVFYQNTVPVNPAGIILRLLTFWNTINSKAAELWVLLLICAQQPADCYAG